MYKVRDFMTPTVLSISKESTIKEAAIFLKRKSVSGAVVAEDDKPVGMITERDIVKVIADGKNPGSCTVGLEMNMPLAYVDADDPFEGVIRLMTRTHFKRIPVVENKRLVGVVSQSDVIKNFFRIGKSLQEKLQSGEITDREFADKHNALFSNLEKVESKKSMVSWHMRCDDCHKTFFVDEINGKLKSHMCPYCNSKSIDYVK